jgi:hypothetical protein
VAEARDAYADLIAAETLATAFGGAAVDDPEHRAAVVVEDRTVEVSLRRV